MTRGSRTCHSHCPPEKLGWWTRLFTVLLFASYVSFVPIHLATEAHFDAPLSSVADADHHHDGHDDSDHGADTDHHTPHDASDHTLTLASPAKAPSVSALVVFILPAIISVHLGQSEPQPQIPVFERIRLPGESPPAPLQPRAPPRV